MIISRTPLRVSLGGGGTDLPSYYRRRGGFLLAGAIDRYVYIAVNQPFHEDIFLKYSQIEQVVSIDEVQHPLIREALRETGVVGKVEISSMADVPAHTGLGSSGAFTVGVLKALIAYQRQVASNLEIAKKACEIEIDRLQEPVGKQDQFISAIGGVTAFEFQPDDSVAIIPVPMSNQTRERLEEDLLLFYTGKKRSASKVLLEQDRKSRSGHKETISNLDRVKEIGRESFEALAAGDLLWFSKLMTEQWELKRERSTSATTQEIDSWINRGLEAGALGGKLVGAGGGGFLMFCSEEKFKLRSAMAEIGLEEVRFGFDYEGSKLLVV